MVLDFHKLGTMLAFHATFLYYHCTNSFNCVSGISGESRVAAQHCLEGRIQQSKLLTLQPGPLPCLGGHEPKQHLTSKTQTESPATVSLPIEAEHWRTIQGKHYRHPTNSDFLKGLIFYELKHHSKSIRPAFPRHL